MSKYSVDKMLFRSLVVFVCCVLLTSICGTNGQKVDEWCLVGLTGNRGRCKRVSECVSAVELASVGIRPTLCESHRDLPIVCCDETDVQPNPFSFLSPDFDSEPADSVVFPDESNTQIFNRDLSKSEQKCMEYAKLFTKTVQAIPLVTNPKPLSVNFLKCDNSIPLIVGGLPAKPGEFPHMAALGYVSDTGIEWNCGGTLISEEFVVTAAHCAKGRRPIVRVRLGDLDLSTTEDGAASEEYGVAQVLVHPQYRPPLKYNDIALVRLSRPVELTRFITPACLWSKRDVGQNKALATGWGNTDFAGVRSNTLMKVALTLVENNQCNKYYYHLPRVLPEGISQTMLCAGEKAGGKDACQGDSGGPLQVVRPNNPCLFDIIGITSFGKGCASPNTAGVFTRISEFIPWIEGIVWP